MKDNSEQKHQWHLAMIEMFLNNVSAISTTYT